MKIASVSLCPILRQIRVKMEMSTTILEFTHDAWRFSSWRCHGENPWPGSLPGWCARTSPMLMSDRLHSPIELEPQRNCWWILSGCFRVNTFDTFLVSGWEHVLCVHSIGNFIIRNDFHIFHRVGLPPIKFRFESVTDYDVEPPPFLKSLVNLLGFYWFLPFF